MKMSGAESAIATLLAQNRYTAIVSAAFSKDEVTLISLEGSEELGTSFHYRVTFVSRRRIRNFADVIGQPMTVGLKLADGKTRFFNGIVAEFSYTGLDDTRRPIYVADLVPYLNVLKLRRNSRVFQNANAASIVKQIFSEYQKCNFKDLTSTTLAAREYCVQYNETDYDFVNRLLEREGIYYYFLHYADRHELVLVDGPGGHKPCTPAAIRTNLSLENDRFQDDIFWSWRETVALRSTEVVLKDYNFEIPLAQLTSAAPVAPVGTGGVPILDEELAFDRISTGEGRRNKKDVVSANDGPIRQLFVFPGGYREKSVGDFYARILSEQLGSEVYKVEVTGSPRQLSVGNTFLASNPFEIMDIAKAPAPSDSWLAVAARIEIVGETQTEKAEPSGGRGEHLYRCKVTAIPAKTQFRASFRTPRPIIAGPQTAIVTGRLGEAITADKYGRIKVQFRWDRASKGDDNSSCWIRVAQSLAGRGFGSLVTPRVGQEVIVEFQDGDPDRPLITGVLYNASNMPSEDLPAKSPRSGFRSRSIDGTTNEFNEVRFDDQRGAEEIYVRAQGDLGVDVGRNFSLSSKDEFSVSLEGSLPWEASDSQSVPVSSTIVATPHKISLSVTGINGKQAVEISDRGIFLVGSEVGFVATKPITAVPSVVPVPSPDAVAAALSNGVPVPLAEVPVTAPKNTLSDELTSVPTAEGTRSSP